MTQINAAQKLNTPQINNINANIFRSPSPPHFD